MSSDVVFPLLIGIGCLLLVLVVHLLTRPPRSRADINMPQVGPELHPHPLSQASPAAALATWHRSHEHAILDFIDHHDGAGAEPPDSADESDQVGDALEVAGTAHPAPDMRAELAALRTAAEAMQLARERDDDAAVERHRSIYVEYRTAWLERLRQFATDEERIGRLHNRDTPAG